MRRIGVIVLDLLFISAWLGLATVVIWIVGSFVYGLNIGPTEWKVLGGYGKQIFWLTVVLWIGLTGLMLLECYGNSRFDDFKSNLWTRILLTNLLVDGPTAYYIGSFRVRALGEDRGSTLSLLKKSRASLDVLYFLSFWGFIALFAAGLALVVFAYSVESFQILAVLIAVLIPLSVIPTFMLTAISLLDAVERPREFWEKENLLKYLNPWSWVFGIRKYYLQILRPEL